MCTHLVSFTIPSTYVSINSIKQLFRYPLCRVRYPMVCIPDRCQTLVFGNPTGIINSYYDSYRGMRTYGKAEPADYKQNR